MSKTFSIYYKDKSFWTYDVITRILLKFLIDSANDKFKEHKSIWLGVTIEKWKVNAIVNEFGFHLDENWTEDQINTIREIINNAIKNLSLKDNLLREEMLLWTMVDNQPIDLRDEKVLSTKSLIMLADAIDQLLQRTLPDAPKGYWWFFGTNGKSTIKKRY